MILVCCRTLPEDISQEQLLSYLNSTFRHQESKEYISSRISGKSREKAYESLYSLLILSKLYSRLSDSPLPAIAAEDSGKPYFKDSNIKFSISHSCGQCAVAVSDKGDVGIDIETASLPKERAVKLAERFFTPAEADEIKKAPEKFTRLWTKKEAEAKFFGKELSLLLKELKNKESAVLYSDVAFHDISHLQKPVTLCAKRENDTILML